MNQEAQRQNLVKSIKYAKAEQPSRRKMKRLYFEDSDYQKLLKLAQALGYYEPTITDEQSSLEAMMIDFANENGAS